MCLQWFSARLLRQWLAGWGAGLLLGLATVLPAQAFAPLSGPVLASTSVPPNVVMLFDNSSSMVLNRITGETRLNIAREAAKEVIADNRNVRFGLFSFRARAGSGQNADEAPGGQLLVSVGSISPNTTDGVTRFNNLNSALNAINPPSRSPYNWTPLAESYYEVTRYMRGLRAFYPQNVTEASREQFQSPIEYRCQKNFGLILTDGLPTYDSQFPNSTNQDPDGNNPALSGSFNLPDWDGDGADVTDNRPTQEGGTFYLDDIAQFAYGIDLRNTARHGITNDLAGRSWNDPRFPVQNMRTYTVGFAVNDSRLESVARAGNGGYYTASNRQELSDALNSALQEINAASGSGGGGVASGPELQADTLFYRTQYDPEGWSGVVEAFNVAADGQVGSPAWSSNATLTPARRASLYQTWRLPVGATSGGVISLNASAYGALGSAQQNVLDGSATIAGLTGSGRGQALLNWARGDTVNNLRSRTRLLGDIINSPLIMVDPKAVLAPRQAADYGSYLQMKRSSMTPSLLVGSNDGFLHVLTAADGSPRLAYLPAAAQAGLGHKARSDYGADASGHRSGVDGPITLADAQLNGIWSTVAVAGLGAGGRALTAIRLFDASISNNALGGLWEINAADSGWEDLGYTYARPVIARLNGQWVVIVGNGYGSANGQAVLYVIDLAKGSQLASIPVGDAGDNGLSSPQVALNASGEVETVYAGDLQGQLWKFDMSGSAADWSAAFGGEPLFSAAADQPITVQPQLVGHPQGGQLVLFGTGKFMEQGDIADDSLQAFYTVWDKPGGSGELTVDDLLAQSITSEFSSGGSTHRTVSQTPVDWGSHAGWVLPLVHDGQQQGERVTRQFATRGNRVIFTTGLIHGSGNDPCVTQGGGWLMVLDIYSGGMLPVAVLDTDGDRRIGDSDEQSAGLDLDIGLPGDLSILSPPPPLPPGCDPAVEVCVCDPLVDDCPDPCGEEYYLIPGSEEVTSVVGTSRCIFNRIMWRQLM